jgi:dethiobiotin synthetase
MTLSPQPRGCFVTGTDTEVGKTRISAALLHWCARQGWRSAGFKPVAAGTELFNGVRVNEDVRTLRMASSLPLTDAEVGPYQFDTACAPHIAAALDGRAIERSVILQAANHLAAHADVLVIEGVGGFCVPLDPKWDTADLAADLGLPVVLVVGLRLGCLNHALLTAHAIRTQGLVLAGWVANHIEPNMLAQPDNIAFLQQQLGVPLLANIPFMPHGQAHQVVIDLPAAWQA